MLPSEAVLFNSDMSLAVNNALATLRETFRESDAGAGWYHYLDDPQPGVTASAVGLFCFRLSGQHFERDDDVLRYLVGQQLRDGEHAGGWPVRTTNGFPIVEDPGCAIVADDNDERRLTRVLLIRNALFDWLRQHRVVVGLWLVAAVSSAVVLALYLGRHLTAEVLLAALVFPVLLLAFQLLWGRRDGRAGG